MKKTFNELLDIIEEIVDGDTLWAYEYYEEKGLPLSWEVDRCTLMKIKEALKRNEPMKPNYGGRFPQCPVCKRLLHSIWQKYCDNCAQAIDWEEL